MKIGMELDAVEELERALERAIATAAEAQFNGKGDIRETLKTVHDLSFRRLNMTFSVRATA